MTKSRSEPGFDRIDADALLANVPAALDAFHSAGDLLETAALVRRLRCKAGLTVPEMAERLGVDNAVVVAIEDGRAEDLTVTLLHRIGRICGATLVTMDAFDAETAAPRQDGPAKIPSELQEYHIWPDSLLDYREITSLIPQIVAGEFEKFHYSESESPYTYEEAAARFGKEKIDHFIQEFQEIIHDLREDDQNSTKNRTMD